MNALRCLAVVGVVFGLSVSVVQSSSPAKNQHTVHGHVVHVDHQHHKFTVRVGGQSGGKHHEHTFHINPQTHFNFMGGKNNEQGKFAALRKGEQVAVHHNGSHLASRVDIHHQGNQSTAGKQQNQGKQQFAAK